MRTEESVVLDPREVRAADIQEKMGGVPLSQAQGTEQFRRMGWPGSRISGMWSSGLYARAREENDRSSSPGDLKCPQKATSVSGQPSSPASPCPVSNIFFLG
jgi:hypothetical protein